MNEIQIEQVLKKDSLTSKSFVGVFAFDEKPSKPPYPSCFVINTENRDSSGEHWLAVFINKDGFGYFFDSYGQPASFFGFEKYMSKISEGWGSSKKKIQTISSYCGYYCILFLIYMSKGRSNEFFVQFRNGSKVNDEMIKRFLQEFV